MNELTKCCCCSATLLPEMEILLHVGMAAIFPTEIGPQPVELKKFTRSYCRTCALEGRVPFLDATEMKALLSKQS